MNTFYYYRILTLLIYERFLSRHL